MKKLILLSIFIFLVSCNNDQIPTISSNPPPAGGCSVTQTSVNTIITCPDGTTASIPALIQPISPVGIITPCGSQSSPWKEVLICLSDGDILSSFSETISGQDTRLAIIPNGNYIDTDESGCNFTVSSDSNNVYVSWNTGSNQYSSWASETDKCVINK